MSSLTDIIFLLLIFFMLTSSMVQITVDLPESNSRTVAPTDMSVMLKKDGSLTYNGKPAKVNQIRKKVLKDMAKSKNKDNATLAIIAETGVEWGRIDPIMKIAKRLKIRAIMATKARKE